MNADQIHQMEPGPELDALVAEKMGLEVLGKLAVTPSVDCCSGYDIPYNQPLYDLEQSRQGWTVRPVYLRDCACPAGERQPGDDDYWGHYAACLDVVPNYSTDIVAAWEIHERMKNDGLWIRFVQALCSVFLYDNTGADLKDIDESLWWMMATAAPHQRSRAALLAVCK